MKRRLAGTDERWLDAERCSVTAFHEEIEARRREAACPLAEEIERDVPFYDSRMVARRLDEGRDQEMASEWIQVLSEGSGVLVFRSALSDPRVIDDATNVFDAILREEEERGAVGDHFAATGANRRIWNSHEKLCVRAPEVFARYNAGDVVPAVSRAWLGPAFQLTSQVNVVLPGAEAQRPHRDYHMGFQAREVLVGYPAHVHRMTPLLTLQGAVAHCDMPQGSGPTKLLPFSQNYPSGYLAAGLSPFQEYFEEHHVQLELSKGDMLFFNPAVFHGAGANATPDVVRMANLLQISSCYGRAMETLDRVRMSAAVFPTLRDLGTRGVLSERETENVVAATAEGYAFPVNLDQDPPVSGMAPPSQQDLLRRALTEGWETERFQDALEEHGRRRRSH